MNLPPQVLAALGGRTLEQAAPAPSGVGKLVPNEHAKYLADYRLAIVGEAPGQEEDQTGRPFVGASGRFLDSLLGAAGIDRDACFVGNICNYRPPANNIHAWPWQSPPIQESLDRLTLDINRFDPHCVLLLGGTALYTATGDKRSIYSWRGSLFKCERQLSPFFGRKCVATFHPAAVLRQYDLTTLLRFDIARARDEATSPTLSLPTRRDVRGLSIDQIIRKMEHLAEYARTAKEPLWCSFDLEGWWNRITRFSIASSPEEGFIVPLTAGEYGSFWKPEDEARLWVAIRRLLNDPSVPKVLQNSLYDRFVLAYKHGVLISNVAWDTMVGHWELYAEMEMNLGLQASIYTREPYWKEDRENDSLDIREAYCCKDSMVTEEIRKVQMQLLSQIPSSWNHAQFNMRLLNPLLYMELRGMRYDMDLAKRERARTLEELWSLQHDFNTYANRTFNGTKQELLAKAIALCSKKREAQYVLSFQQLPAASTKAYLEASTRLADLDKAGAFEGDMSATTLGEVETLLEIGLNTKSDDLVEWLYIEQRYERQYKEDKDGKATLTANVDALLNLYLKEKSFGHDARADVLKQVLKIRKLRYIETTLDASVDEDGRMRCAYSHVGPETGRAACKGSPTGSGYNLQTVTKKLRKLFLADDGHYMFQIDLAGADGWTVAAHCKSLGDPTMWDDYMYGLKPAKIIARIYMQVQQELTKSLAVTRNARAEIVTKVFQQFNALPREVLKELCKEVDQDGWLYFASKRIQHGSNYKMSPPTITNVIIKDSHKFLGEPVYVDPSICAIIQQIYLMRYPGVTMWQDRVAQHVLTYQTLTAANGRIRRFFGRIKELGRNNQIVLNHETWRAACSNEPQDNTTYATNWALYNLWHDVENRDSTRPTGLIIEPLHQVHDALNGQFPIDRAEWAVPRLREYFNNTLIIGGVPTVIPFEGAYGRSWGELTAGTI